MDKKTKVLIVYTICAVALVLAIVSIARPLSLVIGPEGNEGPPGDEGPRGTSGTTIIATKISPQYNFSTDTNLFDSLDTTLTSSSLAIGDVVQLFVSGKAYGTIIIEDDIEHVVGTLVIRFGLNGTPSLFADITIPVFNPSVPREDVDIPFSFRCDLTVTSLTSVNCITIPTFTPASFTQNIAFDVETAQTFSLAASPDTNLVSFDIYQVLLSKLN